MKKSLSYIITFCLGIVLASSGAFAAVGDVIEAKFSQFNFVVDGNFVTLEADPLVYQGSTYLPVRVVANLVGKEVVYKADSRTIELNTPNESSEVTAKMVETNVDIPVSQKIKLIDDEISNVESGIEDWTKSLQGIMDKEMKAKVEDGIEKARRKLADLESQKAALEVQQ